MKGLPIRASALLLLAALLLPSCARPEAPSASSGGGAQTAVTDAGETETDPVPLVPDELRFDGEEIRVLYRDGAQAYNVTDVVAEPTLLAEPVNSAVHTRNISLSDRFGVEIVAIPKTDPSGAARRDAMTHVSSYDLVTDSMTELFPLGLSGGLTDWADLEYVDPENPWWDRNAARELSLAGRRFLMIGDLSMNASSRARFLYFNKRIAEDNHLSFPYAEAREGTWTLDHMIRMIEAVSADLNGDGAFDYHDRFGLIYETHSFFLSGCGVLFTEKDEDDLPEIAFVSERTVDAIHRLKDLSEDKTHVYTIDALSRSGSPQMSDYAHVFDYGRGLFAGDHFLFVQNGANVATEFTDMKSEYGILPEPKYDESQPSYYHLMDQFACAWSIPANVRSAKMVDAVTDYWCYLSSLGLVDAFYEVTMKSKRLQAPEDAAMLDIVRDTIRYELSTIADMGVSDCLDTAFRRGDLFSAWREREARVRRSLGVMVSRAKRRAS